MEVLNKCPHSTRLNNIPKWKAVCPTSHGHKDIDINTNICVREMTTILDIISNVRKNEMVLGRPQQQPKRRPMDLSRHNLGDQTTRQDAKGDRRRDGLKQILEGHDLIFVQIHSVVSKSLLGIGPTLSAC